MRGTCALSFVCSVTCIVAAFGYLGLLHERSAAGYAACEVAATHNVLITMWLSHATMEAMLLLSFAFALAAVVLGVLRLLDNVTGVIVLVLVACIVALAVYLRAATLWVASSMRFRPAAAPGPAQGAAGAEAAAAKPGPVSVGGPAAGQPADAAAKMVLRPVCHPPRMRLARPANRPWSGPVLLELSGCICLTALAPGC
jgi:hypothetical protein